ncbi:MAG TPA: deoxyguanosinetriphosphate triphosphohydrolase, partial [Firmicutes bacterium]|nr:deoxyguanosinetriphosphate triphosphohydrolase [Bacillota bacterium]
RIAYINHDIDDALRAGIITAAELPPELLQVLGHTHSERINTMVCDLIAASRAAGSITLSSEVGAATDQLREFLFAHVYVGSRAKSEDAKARHLIAELYRHFTAHPAELPPEYTKQAQGDTARATCDYIAGMTDRYARSEFLRCFLPQSWGQSVYWD